MEILLLRHSIAEGNAERRYIGVTDAPLSEAGIALALERRGQLPLPEFVYVSPLARCVTTAELLWPHAERAVVPALREIDFGVFENRTHEELMKTEPYRSWFHGAAWDSYPGGEVIADFHARAGEAFWFAVEDARQRGYHTRIAIVAHGGTLMGILSRYLEPKRLFHEYRVQNLEGYVLRIAHDNRIVDARKV